MRGGSPPAATSLSRISRATWLLPLPGRPRSSTAIRLGRPLRPGPGLSNESASTVGCGSGCAAAAAGAGGRGAVVGGAPTAAGWPGMPGVGRGPVAAAMGCCGG